MAGTTDDLIRRREAVVARGVPRIFDLAVAEGEGFVLRDPEGREYLDLATGIGVMSLGHGRPEVVDALIAQARRLQHTCFHVATYEPYVALCERLVRRFPHGGRTKAMLVNSGAEAVENAIKIARQATGRAAVICYTGAFHGRTLLGMTLTSKTSYKTGCGPFAPEVYRLPFPDRFRYGGGLSESAFVARELARLREALLNTVQAEHTAAILIEALQGEGGFVPCPPDYLRGLRNICDETGIMLVIDEVQTGFCRTGRWAAYEHAGVTPDLSTWAKALGGGLPVAAVLGRAEVVDAARPGTLGGTYGGNPVACASALAAIDVMEAEGGDRAATALGTRIRARLEALRGRCALVADVRGLGAMMAIELCHDRDPGRPATKVAKDASKRCLKKGAVVLTAGVHGNVLRLLPPLTMPAADLDRGLSILEAAVLEAAAEAQATESEAPALEKETASP